MTTYKAFAQCSLSDLAPTISLTASTLSHSALDSAEARRLLPYFHDAKLTELVLRRHSLVRSTSGRLICNASADSKRAWCGMLRDLFTSAGARASDALLMRIYIICKDCAKRGRVALIPPLDYYDAFLGRPMSIAPRNCAQISAPLCLIRAAAGHLRLPRDHVPQRQQQRLHLSCAGVSFWPMQLQRAAIGCAAALSRRLTTAPASCLFSAVTMQRWAARVQVRVMGCLIGRLQVRLSRALQFARLRKR